MNFLITCDIHPLFIQGLENNGHYVHFRPNIGQLEVLEIVKGYEGLIVKTSIQVNEAMINAGRDLKLIGRAGSGMENIDIQYAFKKDIVCISSPEGNRNAVAEHVIGMLLALMNHIVISNNQVRQGIWNREANRGNELTGMTLGIIGFGNTGSFLAKRLAGFDLNILAYDKYKSGFGNEQVKESTMEDLFENADIVSLHIPYSSETRFLVNSAFLNRFSKNIILINTSRGGIIHTEDVLDGLTHGKVKGACLDVLENEPVQWEMNNPESPIHKLIQLNQLILTPHIAGWTVQSKEEIAKVLLQKIHNAFPAS